jgi:AbrB family looped-hinge helix DNA binding protein
MRVVSYGGVNARRAKVSAEGQIVIPGELRVKYAIGPGDVVDLCDEGGRTIVFPLPNGAIRAAYGFLGGPTSLSAALLKARAEEA